MNLDSEALSLKWPNCPRAGFFLFESLPVNPVYAIVNRFRGLVVLRPLVRLALWSWVGSLGPEIQWVRGSETF